MGEKTHHSGKEPVGGLWEGGSWLGFGGNSEMIAKRSLRVLIYEMGITQTLALPAPQEPCKAQIRAWG